MLFFELNIKSKEVKTSLSTYLMSTHFIFQTVVFFQLSINSISSTFRMNWKAVGQKGLITKDQLLDLAKRRNPAAGSTSGGKTEARRAEAFITAH